LLSEEKVEKEVEEKAEVKDAVRDPVVEIQKLKKVNGEIKKYALHREFRSCETIDNLLSYDYDK